MFQRAELEPPSLIAMRKLSKRDVEALLAEYDNSPTESLLIALRILFPQQPSTWDEAVSLLDVDDTTKTALRNADTQALDALVKQFVETRAL